MRGTCVLVAVGCLLWAQGAYAQETAGQEAGGTAVGLMPQGAAALPIGEGAKTVPDTGVGGVLGGNALELEMRLGEIEEAMRLERAARAVELEQGTREAAQRSWRWDYPGYVQQGRAATDVLPALEVLGLEYGATSGGLYANPVAPTALVGRYRGLELGGLTPALGAGDLGLRAHTVYLETPRLTLTPDLAPLRTHIFPGARPGFND
ncbi:MAG: hypothetical protein V2A58_10730 [Planctomycetota bacterium]